MFLIKLMVFSFFSFMTPVGQNSIFAADPPSPPKMVAVTRLVVKDKANPKLNYRARLGFDYKKHRYFVKDMHLEYPVHKGIVATVFWVGEEAGPSNGNISNVASAWDEKWLDHFGGVDEPTKRKGFFPKGFIPKENPFYVALPCNDLNDQGVRKDGVLGRIYWGEKFKDADPEKSILKDRWVRIRANGRDVYAQWEDAGPFGEDDWNYVFGSDTPSNKKNDSAGIDVSPAVRDYLGLTGLDKVEWQFVEYEDVPAGPWLYIKTGSGPRWYHPSTTSSFYWQLQGKVSKDHPFEIFDIDLFDNSKETVAFLKGEGKHVICYFSAGSSESWRPDFEKFLQKELGKPLDGWPDERWLDIRSENVRNIMLKRLDLAKEKGCDGVEPDNVDGFLNDTGFPLTYEDQLSFNRFIAKEAHRRGLAVFLKNDLEQSRDLVRSFDALLLEECMENDECDLAGAFIDSLKPVFDVEYDKDVASNDQKRDTFCKRAKKLGIHLIFMTQDLDGSFLKTCQ